MIGDRSARFVPGGLPRFTDPVPFTTMELRYERAYGGIDVFSDKATSYPYPRNPMGRGFVVANTRKPVDGLELPNLEDPAALLNPRQLCLGEYSRWEKQPFPAGLGWFPKTWYPRALLAGIMPADRPVEQELRAAYGKLLPPDQRAPLPQFKMPLFNLRLVVGVMPNPVRNIRNTTVCCIRMVLSRWRT